MFCLEYSQLHTHLRLFCSSVNPGKVGSVVTSRHKRQYRALQACSVQVVLAALLCQPGWQRAGRWLLLGGIAPHAGSQDAQPPQPGQAAEAVWQRSSQSCASQGQTKGKQVGRNNPVIGLMDYCVWMQTAAVVCYQWTYHRHNALPPHPGCMVCRPLLLLVLEQAHACCCRCLAAYLLSAWMPT